MADGTDKYDFTEKEKAIKNIGSDPNAVENADEVEDAKMELLRKIKDASNGPEQAKRKIELLDKAVGSLKKKRHICGEQIRKDTEALKWLQQEIDTVERLRNKLERNMKVKINESKRLDGVIANMKETIKDIANTTSRIRNKTSQQVFKLQRKSASEALRQARGFGCEKGSTFYQTRRPKKY